MAFRTWVKLFSATLGVGALAGASQLGLAYGLGIVRLTRVLDVTARDQWTAQLAWVAWIPMVAAVAGALGGARMLRRWQPEFRPGAGTEVLLAFAAAIGAAVVVPLTMQPARTAQVAGVNPVVVIAICAGIGALVGVFAAWGAVAQAVARWSLAATGIAIWTVAVVSVAPSMAPGDALPAVRLGVFDAGFLSPALTQRTALATMPALALLLGAVLGWTARRRDLPTLTIALAGLPGPALLTISYLIAGPGSGDARYQIVPYWAAMTATGAGVLGSVLAAVLRRSPAADEQDDADGATQAGDDRPPLPKRVEQPTSAIAAAAAPPAPAPTPPAPERPEPQTPTGTPEAKRPPVRRSSVAAAFTGRTGEFPTHRSVPLGEYATPEPAPFDAFARGTANTAPAPADQQPTASKPQATGPVTHQPNPQTTRPAQNPPNTAAPKPFAPSTGPGSATPAPAPYVPEPATRPIPPEALQAPTAEQPRPAPGRLGRSLRPFARGRTPEPTQTAPSQHGPSQPGPSQAGPTQAGPTQAGPARVGKAEPLTPEPTMISAPLPQPQPVTPPLPVTPAPPPASIPQQAKDEPRAGGGRSRFGLRRRKDEEIVDWVSGLGN